MTSVKLCKISTKLYWDDFFAGRRNTPDQRCGLPRDPPAYHELDLSGNMPVYQELDTSINPSVYQDSVLPPHEPVGQPPPVSTLSRIRFRNGFKC